MMVVMWVGLPWPPRRAGMTFIRKANTATLLQPIHQLLVSSNHLTCPTPGSEPSWPGLHPEAAYYNNRAAALIMLMDYEAALADAKTALSKDGNNPKVSSLMPLSFIPCCRS